MLNTALRTGLGGLVVALALPLLGSPLAQAAPTTPSPAPSSAPPVANGSSKPSSISLSFTTTGNVGEKITVTSNFWKHGGQKQGHLDWSAAKKYFGKHTTWRDDFVAGAQAGGATLDHAAESTKTRLRARWNNMGSAAKVAAQRAGGGTNCQGVSKTVKWNGERSEDWYDSCDTNILKNHWKYCTAAMGFATFASPSFWKGIPVVFGLICGQKVDNIATAQANSKVNAIKYYNYRIERKNSKVDGQYYIRATLLSQ